MPRTERPQSEDKRPDNREVEYENLRPGRPGEPPRPATEPAGAAWSQKGETATDPGTGAPQKVSGSSGSSRRKLP